MFFKDSCKVSLYSHIVYELLVQNQNQYFYLLFLLRKNYIIHNINTANKSLCMNVIRFNNETVIEIKRLGIFVDFRNLFIKISAIPSVW